ncbi:hypothetical protein A6A07_04625 [Streptomyces sp. CB03911]|nr:hypothetical protein A6A07_04625 [Streptomyces sp. CB03911]
MAGAEARTTDGSGAAPGPAVLPQAAIGAVDRTAARRSAAGRRGRRVRRAREIRAVRLVMAGVPVLVRGAGRDPGAGTGGFGCRQFDAGAPGPVPDRFRV